MRLTSALAERSGTERDDGFVLKGVAALTTLIRVLGISEANLKLGALAA
jgi:hypothetical protein